MYSEQPYQSPFVNSIAESLAAPARIRANALRQTGAIQAQAQQQRGQILGQTVAQIGQTIGAIPGQIAQQQQQAQAQQVRDLQVQQLTREEEAATQAEQTAKAIDGLMRGSLVKDPDTGLLTYDRPKLQQGFTDLGIGSQWPDYAKRLDESDAAIGRVRTEQAAALKLVAGIVDASGNDATVFTNELERAIENGLITERQAAPYQDAVKRDPTRIAAITASILGKAPAKPNLQSVDPTRPIVDMDTGQTVTPGTPAAPPPVTFSAPVTMLVEGKRTPVRPGSDAKFYNDAGVAYEPGKVQALPDTPTKENRTWVTRNGQAAFIPESQIQPGDVPYKATTASETDPDMPSLYRNALDRSIMSIPAVRRGTVVQLANRLFREGNLDELKSTIKQAAIEGENVDTKNQVRGREATKAALADTKLMLAELQAKGVPTNWFSGTAEDLARRLGTSTNPDYVRLGTRLMDTLITYRRAATGVQFSAKETEQYAKMFPNYKQSLPVNLATLDGMLRAISTNDRVFWEQKLGKDGADLVVGDSSSDVPTSVPAGVKITTTVSP